MRLYRPSIHITTGLCSVCILQRPEARSISPYFRPCLPLPNVNICPPFAPNHPPTRPHYTTKQLLDLSNNEENPIGKKISKRQNSLQIALPQDQHPQQTIDQHNFLYRLPALQKSGIPPPIYVIRGASKPLLRASIPLVPALKVTEEALLDMSVDWQEESVNARTRATTHKGQSTVQTVRGNEL